MKRDDKSKILVVNDTPDQVEMITVLLEQAGYLVQSAANGIEGLRVADQDPLDLIISDVSMPRMDGFELCRRLARKA